MEPDNFYKKYNFKIIKGASEDDKVLDARDEVADDRIMDLLLIMDCTGSMQQWMNLCKTTLTECITTFQRENSDVKIRIAFVGYRDIKDKDIFVIQDFTFDAESVKTLINSSPASGGGDTPEDVQGALYHALKLSWRRVSVKIAYLCTDAPGHGKQYHSADDDFPDGNPAGLILEDLMTEYSNRGIDFTVYQLQNGTQNMYRMMQAAYDQGENKGQFKQINLQNVVQAMPPAPIGGGFAKKKMKRKKHGRRGSVMSPVARGGFLSDLEEESEELSFAPSAAAMPSMPAFTASKSLEVTYSEELQSDMRSRAEVQFKKLGWSKSKKKGS